MKRFLGFAVIVSMVCAFALAQDTTTVRKPATTPPTKVEGSDKMMKDDCCSGEKAKVKSEGCGAGCGDCTDMPKSTNKTKAAAGAAKAKTTTAPKTK